MSWLFAILLAALCFATIAFVFRMPRRNWTIVLAALAFGLAGYAFQASPGLPGAPRERAKEEDHEADWRLVDLRKELVGEAGRSTSNHMVTADALMRRGQYENAARLLRGVVQENPEDGEAWLAMANALTFQADGMLTPAALLAFRRAAQAGQENAGPSFFIGLALIRQGQLIEGREVWSEQLKVLPEGTPGREILAERLGDLDELLLRISQSTDDSAR